MCGDSLAISRALLCTCCGQLGRVLRVVFVVGNKRVFFDECVMDGDGARVFCSERIAIGYMDLFEKSFLV